MLDAAAPATAAPESTPATASGVDGGLAAVDENDNELESISETMAAQAPSGGGGASVNVSGE